MGDQHYWQGVYRQRIGRRRLLGTATAGVAAIGAVAIGCGDDDDDEGQAPSPGGSPAAAAQPKRGGTFASSRTNEVPHLDVHQATTVTLAGVGPGMSYSRLMALKLGPEGLAKNKVVPQGDVVERWEQPDDRTYVFKLRPGVKFFNIAPVNGRELVAEDIVYSFKRQQDLKFTASFLGPVEKVEATDRQTVRVTLSRPDNDQLVIFADPRNKIVAKEAVDAKGDLKEGPVIGTGAWMFQDKEWERNTVHRYLRNPDYFIKGQPYAERFDDYIITDPSTRTAAFRTKKLTTVSFSGQGGKAEAQRLARELSGTTVVEQKSWLGHQFWVNTTRPPLNDKRVRQALLKAVDRPQMTSALYDGAAWTNTTIKLPSEDWALPESEMTRLLARDVAGARQLLQQAGVTNWSPKLTGMVAVSQAETELVQSQLKEAGINATIEMIPLTQFTERIQTRGEFEMFVGLTSVGASTNSDLQARWGTGGSINGPRLSDPELDRLIQQQATEKDEKRRRDLLLQIQRYVIDVASIIPLVSNFRIGINWNFLKNWEPSLSPDWFEYYNHQLAWLDQ